MYKSAVDLWCRFWKNGSFSTNSLPSRNNFRLFLKLPAMRRCESPSSPYPSRDKERSYRHETLYIIESNSHTPVHTEKTYLHPVYIWLATPIVNPFLHFKTKRLHACRPTAPFQHNITGILWSQHPVEILQVHPVYTAWTSSLEVKEYTNTPRRSWDPILLQNATEYGCCNKMQQQQRRRLQWCARTGCWCFSSQ